MRYKDFYVRITPDRSIQRVDKKGNEVFCDGFIIRIFADENKQIEIDNFTAAVGFEILEDSFVEAVQFAKDFIDCENKIYQIDSNPIVT